MDKILCATRGGDSSFQTQDKAIQMALDQDALLIFLYVVDTRFIDKTSAPIVVDVEEEISKLGEFLLLMAKERAREQGLKTETVLKEGKVRDELLKVIQEEDITMVVFGKPAGESSVFDISGLENYTRGIEDETGVPAVIV